MERHYSFQRGPRDGGAGGELAGFLFTISVDGVVQGYGSWADWAVGDLARGGRSVSFTMFPVREASADRFSGAPFWYSVDPTGEWVLSKTFGGTGEQGIGISLSVEALAVHVTIRPCVLTPVHAGIWMSGSMAVNIPF